MREILSPAMTKKKTKTKARKSGRKKGGAKSVKEKVRNMPKPIREKVLKIAEKPEDIAIVEPAAGDPIVHVRDKTVGAWVDI